VTRALCLAASLIALPLAGTAWARPWQNREPSVSPTPAHQLLRTLTTWPAEPPVPAPIDPARFQAAFAYLCGVKADSEIAGLAPQLLAAVAGTPNDPFTFAALAQYRSRCEPDYKGKGGTYGLFGIEPGMYRGVEGAPPVPVEKDDLTAKRLLDPAVNMSVAAKLLAMWDAQHREIDVSFGGAQHRSAVSHMVWGDQVRSSGQEDLILTARRRMIVRYNGSVDTPRPSLYGIDVVSPLEATPRVATSGPGDDRDGGARRHRGLDIVGQIGEPVRSIADGTVIFAGVNMPGGRSRLGPIPPEKIKRYAHRQLGVGGIYVCIEHKPGAKRIVSCYMHLASYTVSEGQQLTAGETIGFVGRTGVKLSPAHLHFEVRVDDRFTNPLKTLGDYVIPPKATQTHQYVVRAKRAKRLRA
jgi:hypothetical protein